MRIKHGNQVNFELLAPATGARGGVRFGWRKGAPLHWREVEGQRKGRWFLSSSASSMLGDEPIGADPSAYRVFAGIPVEGPEEAARACIVEFASTYGVLGEPLLLLPDSLRGADYEEVQKYACQPESMGEPFTLWSYEVSAMAKFLGLFDALELLWGQSEKERDWQPVRECLAQTFEAAVSDGEGWSEAKRVYLANDLGRAARLLLAFWVNEHLPHRIKFRFELDPHRHDHQGFDYSFQPASLLGYLWWSAAQLLTGGDGPVQCPTCKNWRALNPRGRPVKFCSDACKDKWHNHLKREAREQRKSEQKKAGGAD